MTSKKWPGAPVIDRASIWFAFFYPCLILLLSSCSKNNRIWLFRLAISGERWLSFLTGFGAVTDLLPFDNLKCTSLASLSVYPKAAMSTLLNFSNSPPKGFSESSKPNPISFRVWSAFFWLFDASLYLKTRSLHFSSTFFYLLL